MSAPVQATTVILWALLIAFLLAVTIATLLTLFGFTPTAGIGS